MSCGSRDSFPISTNDSHSHNFRSNLDPRCFFGKKRSAPLAKPLTNVQVRGSCRAVTTASTTPDTGRLAIQSHKGSSGVKNCWAIAIARSRTG